MRHYAFVLTACLALAVPAAAQMVATTGGGGVGCCSLYALSASTGALSLIGTPDFGAAAPLNLGLPGVDFASDGRLFVVTGTDQLASIRNSLARLDPVTGALVEIVGALDGPQDDIRDIAINPITDVMYASSYDGHLYTINLATAAVTEVGGTLIDGPLACLSDGTLFMAQMNPEESAALYTVNPSNGDATLVASLSRYYIALGRGPDGMLYAADFAGNEQWEGAGGTWGDVYRINPTTGQETFVGSNTRYVIHDIAFLPSEQRVPTLTAVGIALLSLGLLVLGWRRIAGS